jgi:hypothetical protein
MDTVPVGEAVTAAEAVLPDRVEEALGELVGSRPGGCWSRRWASARAFEPGLTTIRSRTQ